jgi:polysaccharide export outer membrane protein
MLMRKRLLLSIFVLLVCVFQAAQSADADEKSYIIRPNDILCVMVPLNLELDVLKNVPFQQSNFIIFGNEIFSKEVITVNPYGTIDLPLIGKVSVEGKSPQEASSLITSLLQKYIPDGRCTITLQTPAPLYINIFGEVTRPNRYTIDREITIFEAIAMAGGFTPFANKRSVKIIRKIDDQNKIMTVNLYKALKKDSLDQNIMLKNNDIVVVEENLL